MPPDNPRLALAASRAQELLLSERIMEPPVPVKELLEQYAIIHPFDHPTKLSYSLEQDLIWQVFLNNNIPEQLVSYVQAHEMGHLFMHHLEYDFTLLTPAQFQLLDCEADHFAYNLITPAEWIHSTCGCSRSVNEYTLAALAQMFSVSPDTMKNRLRYLGIPYKPFSFDSRDMDRLFQLLMQLKCNR
jgi:Zn-dependent peptidase ImmA (M78 family)